MIDKIQITLEQLLLVKTHELMSWNNVIELNFTPHLLVALYLSNQKVKFLSKNPRYIYYAWKSINFYKHYQYRIVIYRPTVLLIKETNFFFNVRLEVTALKHSNLNTFLKVFHTNYFFKFSQIKQLLFFLFYLRANPPKKMLRHQFYFSYDWLHPLAQKIFSYNQSYI